MTMSPAAQRAIHRTPRYLKANRERRKTQAGMVSHAKANKIYEAAHPEKRLARQAVRKAVRNGVLVRQPCEVCGNEKSEGHHDDYSRLLVVRWLCGTHHKLFHRLLRGLE
jgi:hypothetical protein